MDAIPIRQDDVLPMEHIADDIAGLRIIFVNVFAVTNPDGTWTLVDGGVPQSARYIRSWVEREFRRKPRAIVLTHGHFDHVGAVQELAEGWDAPIYAHPLEMPFVTGQESYPPPDPSVGGGLMAVMSPLYPKGPYDFGNRVRTFSPDGSVKEMPGWRWIHTPGHTRGHVSFFRQRDRALLVGDAFCTTKAESMLAVATMRPELSGPPAYFTPDWEQAKASVQKLADLRPVLVIPGHGRPMSDIADGVAHLAADFDRIARPEHGKYVNQQDGEEPAA